MAGTSSDRCPESRHLDYPSFGSPTCHPCGFRPIRCFGLSSRPSRSLACHGGCGSTREKLIIEKTTHHRNAMQLSVLPSLTCLPSPCLLCGRPRPVSSHVDLALLLDRDCRRRSCCLHYDLTVAAAALRRRRCPTAGPAAAASRFRRHRCHRESSGDGRTDGDNR